MTGQSKKMSLTESLLNVAIGYGIAIAAQVVIFPWFGIHIPLHDNLKIGALFTVVSIVRSYCLRRAFNRLHRWQEEREFDKFMRSPIDPNATYSYRVTGVDEKA